MKKLLSIILIFTIVLGGMTLIFNNVYAANSASISSSANTITKGQKITVTVNLGQNVTIAQFKLDYDHSILKCIGSSVNDSTGADYKKQYFEGSGKFSYYNGGSASKVTFTFEGLKTGETTIKGTDLKIRSVGSSDKESISINGSAKVTVEEKKETPTPTAKPTSNPTKKPTTSPTKKPTSNPTKKPTTSPTKKPTKKPTSNPTKKPSTEPSIEPTATLAPSETPSVTPTSKAPNKIIEIDDENSITLKDDNNNIIVKALEIALENDVILKTDLINENEDKYKALEKIIEKIKGNKKYFDITLLKDNVKVQPNGYVTVYIPIPEEYDEERLELYYINEQTNKYEKKQGEIIDDYYVFTTNHFSKYALVETEENVENTSESGMQILLIALVIVIIVVATVVIVKVYKRNK